MIRVSSWLDREPVLPVAVSGGHKKFKIRPPKARIPAMPAISYEQAFTYLWLLLSLIVALMGYTSCRTTFTRILFKCSPSSCTYERYQGSDDMTPVERISFPREYFINAQTTRTRNGEAVDFNGVRRRRQRVLGHSFLLKYKARSEEDPTLKDYTILFTKHNIGRKRARRQAAEVNKYIKGEVDWLDIAEFKKWTAFGVLLLAIGLVSAAFAVLCGDLTGGSDERKKHKSR